MRFDLPPTGGRFSLSFRGVLELAQTVRLVIAMTISLVVYPLPVHHDGSTCYVIPAAPRLGDEVTLRLRLLPGLKVSRVMLCTHPDGERLFTGMLPEDPRPGEPCRWWRGTLRLQMSNTAYRFLIFTDEGAYWYNAAGLHEHTPTDAADFRILASYRAPEWVRQAVFYQIMPDRFADGDPSNSVREGEYEFLGVKSSQRKWGETPTAHGMEAMLEFFGGDLPGITQRLDYLDDLGVTALYLNPIFSAYSNHRYDVTDYENVDPHLGGNAALAALRSALAERGMRYILDVVPNHCGVMHPWFQAAQADANAPTAEYFTFHQHPEEYESWLGVKLLPKLNYRSQALRQVMYAEPEAIFRRWLRPPYAADGWRIDVANMLARHGFDQLGTEVGRGIRQAVKEENPAAYLMGENFFDATPQLQGDTWDGVMNYAGFTQPTWYWLNRLTARARGDAAPTQAAKSLSTAALLASWQATRAGIPWQIACQQFNLLGSHDTPRILTTVGDDTALARLAAALLFTYPGVPCVYYGDEIGLSGSDPRACMPWDEARWDQPMRQYYQTLIGLRRASRPLAQGGFQVLMAEENTFAFQRDVEGEWLIVLAQRGTQARPAGPLPVAPGGIPDGIVFTELFSGSRRTVENGCLALPEAAPGAQIWCSHP